jgi:hypothetical protein
MMFFAAPLRKLISDLLPIEWVKTGAFLRVDADFKGFFVNLPVTG